MTRLDYKLKEETKYPKGDPRLSGGKLVMYTREGSLWAKYCVWCIPGGDKVVEKRSGVSKMTSSVCPEHYGLHIKQMLRS